MKKLFLLASGISLCLSQLLAATVTVQDAQAVAVNFYKGNVAPAATVTATLKYTRTEADGIVDYYIFDMVPTGFVIVAADDKVQPVIGYSGKGLFQLGFEQTGVKDWTDHAAKHIHAGILSSTPPDARISGLWATYRSGPFGAGTRSAVAPLLATTWDQEPYYNALCPFYAADNQRAVTGCVATAMAQVMKYWNYPTHGTGSYTYADSVSNGYSYNYGTQTANFAATTYAWASMPNSINASNIAVATLMYHCGVSVGMDYGDDAQDGSGAWVIQAEAGGPARPCAEYAFRHYWAYDTTTLQGLSEANYSSAQWIALLEADLNAGRPIQYEGDDIGGGGGHSWVCDGYDANDMMHMNWGWSGSNDGYFAINALTAGGYNFSADEGALIGIQPPPVFQVLASAASGTVCHGGLTQITATGPASATYSWTPTTGLACATCATTTATPTATTAYSVTVDSAGIQVQNSVLVTVAPGITAGFIAPTARSCSAPAYISFTNTSQYAATYVWDFGDGTQGTDTTPYHTYTSYGTYTVKLTATGACGVDSVTKAQYISVIDITPTASGASVCHGTSATLTATTPAGTSIQWSDSLGDVVDTNAVFHTPAITVNTNYYLQSSIAGATQYAGPATDAFGTGGNFASQNGHSVIFDCHSPQTLVSVDVYAQGDAVRTIEVLDAAGDVYDSISIDIPDGHSTVPLHFYLPAQTGLMLNAGGNINLYRNQTGANYPYYSADSSVVLTGSDAGPAYYYFFYHWRLQALACTSDPVPVTVSVMNGAATFTTQATALAVSFTPTVTTASSYQWSFGDGATSTDQNPSHTYATSGTYTVQLIESNGSCTDTLSQQIAAYATGITSLTALQNMTVYPNPAHDRLSVSVGASQPTACQLIITDMIGQTVSDRAVQLTGGSNTFTEAVATYAPGVYTVTLMSGDAKVTGRFIKE